MTNSKILRPLYMVPISQGDGLNNFIVFMDKDSYPLAHIDDTLEPNLYVGLINRDCEGASGIETLLGALGYSLRLSTHPSDVEIAEKFLGLRPDDSDDLLTSTHTKL